MEFSRALRALPAFLCFAQPLLGQARYRVTTDGEWFYQEAGGRRLARLARGALASGGDGQSEWVRVTIEGWIFETSVGPTPRTGFDLAVTRAPEENLRSAPAGALVAKLAQGFLLIKLGDDGRWVHVKRDGWVRRSGLEPVALADTGAGSGRDTAAGAPEPGRVRAARRTTLYRAPEGPPAGAIDPEAPLRVLSRSGEWARVQFEGWVKSTDLEAAPAGVLVGVSAAELRAEPERYQGQVLRWTLQFLALQVADDLRPDIPPGATYILARGPLPERGFVYVVVPGGRRSAAETLTPLATVQVTGRVRTGRSRFLGHPVVDLIALETVP